MRRPNKNQRGFALLIVVMLVALLALTGAALLDIVSVDLSLSAEHSKIVRAQMVSDGALREVLTDVNTGDQLPAWGSCSAGSGGGPAVNGIGCPNLRYNWASEVGGNFVKNPDGVPPTVATPLDENNSVFAKRTNSDSEENYTATIDLLRYGPARDTGQGTLRAAHFEVNTTGKVGGNRTRYETSAEIYTYVPVGSDNTTQQYHFR